MDARQCGFVEGHRCQLITRRVDHVVHLNKKKKKGFDVGFERLGVAEVVGEAAEAAFGGGVGLEQGGDGGVDPCGARGREDYGGLGFEARFGDAVADTGGAADNAGKMGG